MVESALVDPLLGSMLGKNYRVLERIGVGGMAVVYLVEHQTLLKRFAAKVLQSEHALSAEARARFTQEAHAASQLDHENIVAISDFGVTSDQRPYFVMELLRGKTLADRLEEEPMTLEAVVAVAVPAMQALAHAHAEGVVHRDVKPENIFLVQRSQGRWGVKVLDFGIAKVAVNDGMTKTGQALGSPMYMAPEACRGDDIDARADVYSFGIMLYLMLVGRVPFTDSNILKILQMQVSAPVPSPSSFNPDISPALEAVLLKALAKEREERFSSMEELLIAFEEALPEGSDVMLLQAHFGASATPIPGSIERVRNLMISASGNFVSVTGRHNVGGRQNTGGQTPEPSADTTPVARPPAPRSRSAPIAIATVILLGGAAAAAYMLTRGHDEQPAIAATEPTSVTPAPMPIEAIPAPSNPTPTEPAPTEPTPTEPTPTEPTPVAVPEPAPVEPVAAAVVEPPPPVVSPPPPAKGTPKTAAKPKTKPTPPPAKVGTKVSPTPSPANGSGSQAPAPAVAAIEVAKPQPEPVAPIVQPKPAPAPIPAPTPAPAPTPTPPAAPAIGSLDATPTIARLDVNGSLPTSVVRRSIERILPSLRTCYQAAAKQKQATPAISMAVRFEIDEGATASGVSASSMFGTLATCANRALQQIQSPQAPDVGTVQVAVSIRFTPT